MQSFTDYEVIVVNDGSPDSTAEVLRPLAESGRIRYIEQNNGGQAAARNRGLREASGTFVAFLDDDDLWPPDRLEWQIRLFEENPLAVLVYGTSTTLGDDRDVGYPPADAPRGAVKDAFLQCCWMTSPGQATIRATALRAVGGFDGTVWGADDWDLYIRLADQGPFVFQQRRALYYRHHPENASRDVWRMYGNCQRVLHKHLGFLPRPSKWRLWLAGRHWITDYAIKRCIHRADQFIRERRFMSAIWVWVRVLIARPEILLRHRWQYASFRKRFSRFGK